MIIHKQFVFLQGDNIFTCEVFMENLSGFEAFDAVKRLIVVAAHPDDLGNFEPLRPSISRLVEAVIILRLVYDCPTK